MFQTTETGLCDSCDRVVHPWETYLAVPEPFDMSLDHYICTDCAHKFPWVLLESPRGRVLIDNVESGVETLHWETE